MLIFKKKNKIPSYEDYKFISILRRALINSQKI